MTPEDCERVDRFILAVYGEDPGRPFFDRVALLLDIEEAISRFRSGPAPKFDKAPLNRVLKVYRAACTLERLLEDARQDWFGPPVDDVRAIKEACRFVACIRSPIAEGEIPEPWGSRFEILVGQNLKDIFERYFLPLEPPGRRYRRAGYKTTDGHTDGRFIQFAERVLDEFGVRSRGGRPYLRGSMADALSKYHRWEDLRRDRRDRLEKLHRARLAPVAPSRRKDVRETAKNRR